MEPLDFSHIEGIQQVVPAAPTKPTPLDAPITDDNINLPDSKFAHLGAVQVKKGRPQ